MEKINFTTILNPYLIQRGQFKSIKEEDIVGLDSLISYDYMGSSEFEFGALSQSLKRMTSSWSEYEWFPLEDIQDADGQVLYVLCRSRQKDEVVQAVRMFATDTLPYRTKESVGLCCYIKSESEYALRVNFWWDVTYTESFVSVKNGNDWMACFGNDIRRLVIAINKVCAKHDVPAVGPVIPPKTDRPVRPQLVLEDERDVLRILYPDGRKTVVVKKNIIEIDNMDNSILKVQVQTRAGLKWIEIRIGLSSIRSLIYNNLKDWPERNTHGRV